jgi:hypothetical protein
MVLVAPVAKTVTQTVTEAFTVAAEAEIVLFVAAEAAADFVGHSCPSFPEPHIPLLLAQVVLLQ